ncbi:MAG: hypothetical protein SFY70_03755 [Bacteroidia bacterium]|nr:hypothetical protein [Bacteroidia bacterium]
MEEEPKVFLPAESYRKKKGKQNLVLGWVLVSLLFVALFYILYLVFIKGEVNTSSSVIEIIFSSIFFGFGLLVLIGQLRFMMSGFVYQYEVYRSAASLEIFYASIGRKREDWIDFEFTKSDVELRIDFWGRLMFYNFRSKKYLPLRRTLEVPDAFLASLNLSDKELIIIREWFRGGKSAIKRFSLPRSYSVTKSW